jgi:3-carboxy-cis,cis-muconate cycloisomerase
MTESIAEIKALLSQNALRQAWLDVESSLAQVQAELGIIPEEAAREITRKANLDFIDTEELSKDIKRTKAPIVSLTRLLAAACDNDYGGYVHWGATTQNIMQTGLILQVRKVHKLTRHQFGLSLTALADLAEQGSEMIMAGRTQRRHALPITFGFKAAGWIDELLRHLERFDQFEPRFFCLQFGGAIGAMQSFGEYGPEINRRLGKLLGLSPLKVSARSAGDFLAEYVTTMSLYATTCSKIAQELYTLMSDEFGEVTEGQEAGVVGSSTMPQKVNSKVACNIITIAARIRSQMGLAFEGMQSSHEGDAANNKMMREAIDTVCAAVYELTTELKTLLSGLTLHPERMSKNLQQSNGLIVAENVMMTLAPVIGRQKAHDVLHEAAHEAVIENQNIYDVLAAKPVIYENFSKKTLQAALDPANYLGHCIEITMDCIGRAKTAAKKLLTQS